MSPQQTIAHYKITAKLGEGGMGTVHCALDTKLNRLVAIKFLSNELADAAARRRFQREAQTASSLNHPHILTVLDAGEIEGRQYLVTEFVDGGTLREWAKAEKRDWWEIVELLVGVADGLATAHEAKILHRDVKPGNILVSKIGYAKLADFGLAKLEERSAGEAGEDTPTVTAETTRPGMLIGTVAYMSPEQASGKAVDARSDTFSFGVVLYELLAGRRPFAGTSELEELKAIVHGSAPPLPGDVPAALRVVVEKALAKDPGERYQSMREMVVDLRRLLRQRVEAPAPVLPQRVRAWKWAVSGAVAVLAGGIGLLLFRPPRLATPRSVEYTQLTNFADSAVQPALSPDGRLLTFIRGADTFQGVGEIYVKLLPDGDPVPLTHDGLTKMGPVFDPTGTRIAYSTRTGTEVGGTWVVPALGGQPSRILPRAEALTFIASGNGQPHVLYSQYDAGVHLSIVTSAQDRSEARTVYAPPSKNGMAHRSYLSPDRKSVLVVEMEGGWLPCRLAPFNGRGAARPVGPSPGQCTAAGWSPDGRWMYFSVNTGSGYHIWRQRFPNGTPEQVTSGASEEEGISFAPDGRSFVTSVGSQQSTLWVHNADGERQITSQGYASLPQFSADGGKLYYLLRSRANRRFVSGELWAADLKTGQNERLLPNFLMEHYRISPDGNRMVFVSIEDSGHTPVWLATLDGSVAPRRLSSMDGVRAFFGAHSDVFFLGREDQNTMFVYSVGEDGAGLKKAIPNPVAYFFDVSPDGTSLAVLEERVIRVYPAGGGSPARICQMCGAAGGPNRAITPPAISWSSDGKLLYLNDRVKHQIYAVPLEAGRNLPPLPPSGLGAMAEAGSWPKTKTIHEPLAFVGPNPSIYAFPKPGSQRNIYRVTLP